MSSDGASKDDVKVPEGDIGQQIQGGFDEGKDLLVTIISAMGEEQVCFLAMSLVSPVVLTLRRPSPSRRRRKAVNRYRICSRNPRSYNLARLEDVDNRYLVIGWCYCNCSPCHILVYIRPRLHSLFRRVLFELLLYSDIHRRKQWNYEDTKNKLYRECHRVFFCVAVRCMEQLAGCFTTYDRG